MNIHNTILAITAPSGAGKSTLINHLLQDYPQYFERYYSVVDRPMRPLETEKNPHIFITPIEFDQLIAEGQFVEYEQQPHNNFRYGKTKQVLDTLDKNKIILTEMRINKVEEFKKALPDYNIISLFMYIDDLDKLRERLALRGDSPEVVENRIKTVYEDEMQHMDIADYKLRSHEGDVHATAEELFAILHKELGIVFN